MIPTPIRWLLGALATLLLALGGSSLFASARARRLTRQRERLLDDAGAMQAALLPAVPSDLCGAAVSVAYRPSDGPAAGGDFYDVFALEDGRTAIVLGDVRGHGRAALGRTALVRHSIRAYLAAGLEPRRALRLTGQAMTGWDRGEFATAVAAIYDPTAATLTYACAGHPPPLTTRSRAAEAVIAPASPPLGLGMPTGLRQTTLSLEGGSLVCFHTDGLTDARVGEERLGQAGVGALAETLAPEASAADLLDRIAEEADTIDDDMATCLLRPLAVTPAASQRIEEFEVGAGSEHLAETFLLGCGLAPEEAISYSHSVGQAATQTGSAVLRAVSGDEGRPDVDFAAADGFADADALAGTTH